MELIELTAQTWGAEVTACRLPVLVMYGTSWCPHCAAVEPTLEHLADVDQLTAHVCHVDCDAQPGLADQAGVNGYPTVVCYLHGAETDRIVGEARAEEYQALVNQALKITPRRRG